MKVVELPFIMKLSYVTKYQPSFVVFSKILHFSPVFTFTANEIALIIFVLKVFCKTLGPRKILLLQYTSSTQTYTETRFKHVAIHSNRKLMHRTPYMPKHTEPQTTYVRTYQQLPITHSNIHPLCAQTAFTHSQPIHTMDMHAQQFTSHTEPQTTYAHTYTPHIHTQQQTPYTYIATYAIHRRSDIHPSRHGYRQQVCVREPLCT